MAESQDCSLELYDPVVQKRGRVGRFGPSAPYQLQGCQMSKYPTGCLEVCEEQNSFRLGAK
jgi:hypothetical protein